MCSGCVQSLNTSRRGASMTRVMTSSPFAALVPRATALLLALQFGQIGFQAVEALFPEDPVMLQPVGGALERARFQPTRPPRRLAPANDQAGPFQHLEVLGDRGKAHVEGSAEFTHRSLARDEPLQNCPMRRVGERRE